MIDSILLGFACGAWSFLWCGPLTSPGMMGNIVPVMYWRLMGVETRWKQWIAKPIFDCPICNSFWISMLIVIHKEPTSSFPLNLVVVVSALFSAFYLTKKYED